MNVVAVHTLHEQFVHAAAFDGRRQRLRRDRGHLVVFGECQHGLASTLDIQRESSLVQNDQCTRFPPRPMFRRILALTAPGPAQRGAVRVGGIARRKDDGSRLLPFLVGTQPVDDVRGGELRSAQ